MNIYSLTFIIHLGAISVLDSSLLALGLALALALYIKHNQQE